MIHELLKHGAHNAIPTAELCNMIGVGERQVRELIERERFDGYVILSTNKGYYLPDTNPVLGQLEVSGWCHMRILTANAIMRSATQTLQLWERGEYKYEG